MDSQVCRSGLLLHKAQQQIANRQSPFDSFCAQYLLADRGYDTDEMLDQALERGMTPVIPPRKDRKAQRKYDKALYKARHPIENAFRYLKEWRGIATR